MSNINSATAIIQALMSLNAYTAVDDDRMAVALVESLQEGETINISELNGEITITFEMSSASDRTSEDLLAEVESYGYSVLADPNSKTGNTFLFTKKVHMSSNQTNTGLNANSSPEAIAAALLAATEQGLATTERMVGATRTLNEAITSADSVKLLSAMRGNVEAAEGKKVAGKAKAWLTSKPAKVTATVAGVALLGAGAVMGMRHFGVPIPFLDSKVIPPAAS